METNGNWRNCVKKVNGVMVKTRCREWETAGNTCLQVEAGTTGFLRERSGNVYGTYFRVTKVGGKFGFTPIWNENKECIGFIMEAEDKKSVEAMAFALQFCSDTLYEQTVGLSRENAMLQIAQAILRQKEENKK